MTNDKGGLRVKEVAFFKCPIRLERSGPPKSIQARKAQASRHFRRCAMRILRMELSCPPAHRFRMPIRPPAPNQAAFALSIVATVGLFAMLVYAIWGLF